MCDNTTTSSGNVKHLGKVTTTSSGTSGIDFGVPPCELEDGSDGVVVHNEGTGVVVAANGDELYLAFENTGCADLSGTGVAGSLVGSQTITGGTGRFDGASGQTVSNGTAAGDGFTLVAIGTITY